LVEMTREQLINEFKKRIIKLLDKKFTGMLNIEIHARQGGIGEVYFLIKDKIAGKITSNR